MSFYIFVRQWRKKQNLSMLNFKCLALCFGLFTISQSIFSQIGLYHEIGVVAGPVQFRSDYGLRENEKTNFGNSGFGVGIVHYINFYFIPQYTTNTYFNDHFKIRNEISFNRANLKHYGELVDPSRNSMGANQLRGHSGVASNLDIGTQLEFFPLSLRSFEAFGHLLAPYASLGVHYTYFSPKVKTTYANPNQLAIGDVTDSSNFYSGWAPGSVDASPGGTFSMVSSIGVRYKIGKLSDIVVDLRGQYYFNDWVDGLNHNLDSNQYNDWLIWLNVGYIIYL